VLWGGEMLAEAVEEGEIGGGPEPGVGECLLRMCRSGDISERKEFSVV
jgi:hypothetical protein